MNGPGARIEWLTVAGDADLWRSIGLTVGDDGLIALIGTSLRIVPTGADQRTGVIGWAISGAIGGAVSDADAIQPRAVEIDGLATEHVTGRAPVFATHELGATALDHVVVLTPDLERTSAAIAVATGCALKRIRDLGSMRQGFHRIGSGGLIVELVERPDVPEGPASFWGVVLIVDDIDDACARIGHDRVSAPKDAVQPGRRIATIRSDVGLGVPVALMTPDAPRP